MRKGVILSYNKKIGIGVIKDSNDQHILFSDIEMNHIPLRNSQVTFDIQYRNGSLLAVNLNFADARPGSEDINFSEIP